MGVKWKLVFPVYSSTKEEHIPAKTFESQMTESNMVGPESPLPEPLMDRDLAALKLQKTYKSFRTRRQLADCAVLVEQRWLVFIICMDLINWNSRFHSFLLLTNTLTFLYTLYRWKLLDFAQLKCSSVSFFEVEKPETAVSRWSRARTRAAKVQISSRFWWKLSELEFKIPFQFPCHSILVESFKLTNSLSDGFPRAEGIRFLSSFFFYLNNKYP